MAWDKSSRCLISSNGLIRLGQGIVYDSRVVSCNLSHSGIRTAVSILEPYGICSDNARTDFTLPLFRAIRDRNRNRIREGVRYYLGRGRGLTPSGDDMLLGMLFINMVRENVSFRRRWPLSCRKGSPRISAFQTCMLPWRDFTAVRCSGFWMRSAVTTERTCTEPRWLSINLVIVLGMICCLEYFSS